MTRGHLQRLIPLTLLGTGLLVVGFSATKAGHPASKLTTDPSDLVQNEVESSVSASTDVKPTVTVDGSKLPLPDSGHVKLDLGDNRNVDVTVSGNTLTVNEDNTNHTSTTSNGNGSVQVNVSTSSSTGTPGGSSSSTFSNSNSFTNISSNGTSIVHVSH